MEHTIIDTDAINTTKRELDEIFKFFDASPHVLADSSVVSDPFVLMRHLINTNWDNMTARLLFTSARKLYRDFGSNSSLYFDMIRDLFSRLAGCTHQADARGIIESWRHEKLSMQVRPGDTLEDLEILEFDPLICEAIYAADGGLIRLIPDDTATRPYISYGTPTAKFPVVETLEADYAVVNALVLLKPLSARQLAALCTGRHTLILTLGHSRKLTDFAAQNAARVTLLEAYQEYATLDLFSDLSALCGQVNSPDGIPQACGSLIGASIHSGILTLYPKRTRLLHRHTHTLMRKATHESSPLIRQALESRITTLLGCSTDIHYPARTQPEATGNESHYMTQLLEASNTLTAGAVGPTLSTPCYTQAVELAASDTLGLFSPLKITKHYTDDDTTDA